MIYVQIIPSNVGSGVDVLQTKSRKRCLGQVSLWSDKNSLSTFWKLIAESRSNWVCLPFWDAFQGEKCAIPRSTSQSSSGLWQPMSQEYHNPGGDYNSSHMKTTLSLFENIYSILHVVDYLGTVNEHAISEKSQEIQYFITHFPKELPNVRLVDVKLGLLCCV